MEEQPGNLRFLTTTRERILALLRRADRTVEELAAALDLTDNTVRTHLAGLQRDGLVQQRGVQRGTRRPAHLYTLTPQADRLFPKAVDEVLSALLAVIGEQRPPEQVAMLLQSAGHRLAENHAVLVGDDLHTRLTAVIAVLNDLGGLMELEEDQGTFSIYGYSCPLARVPLARPEVCGIIAEMVAILAGVPTHERCERSASLSCWFVVQPI